MSAPISLHELTTVRLGGPAGRFVKATTEARLVAEVRAADEAGVPVLLVAGGSNLVVADEGFGGLGVQIATTGVVADVEECDDSGLCGGVLVRVAAGEGWDDFVARCVARGWVGVEALSGIPGSVGATPVQNVGAYGQEVAQTIARVRTFDRVAGVQRTFTAGECDFSYRQSRFKAEPDRYLVLEVTFQLLPGTLGAPVRYAELARSLEVEPGQRADLAAVRSAVLGLRAGKGMVLDPSDHDTWSAGSFFTNPILPPEQADSLPEDAPRYPQPDGLVKTSAAWLIEHAGFGKGYGQELGGGRVSLSTKHTLALTNRGNASTADLLALAREVRDGVQSRFGIRLLNEPVLVNCSL